MQNTTIQNYIDAGYPFLWVKTHEEGRFLQFAGKFQLPTEPEKAELIYWDCVTGFRQGDKITAMPKPTTPLEKLLSLPAGSILIYMDASKFVSSLEWQRNLKIIESACKAKSLHIIFVSQVQNIPVELEKIITVVDFSLPTVSEIQAVAKRIISCFPQEKQDKILVGLPTCKSASGLTLNEAENAISLSLAVQGKIAKPIIENEKLQAVRKSGCMEIVPPVDVSQMGGLDGLKKYITSRKIAFENPDLPRLQGILLVGLPGAGKSLSAKVIASVLDMPLLRLDIASLKSSGVGDSEKNVRAATALIDAISPCVVWLDEIEKALGGVQSSNRTDGGTTSAMFGHLLTWMQESQSDHYIVATCNDIKDLLKISQGALLRRFDDVFFVDLPSSAERKIILSIMNKRYKTSLSESLAESALENFTGAEIEKLCKASVFEGLEDALKNTKTIYSQNQEDIEKAREWAKHNARLANSEPEKEKTTGRKINLPKEAN